MSRLDQAQIAAVLRSLGHRTLPANFEPSAWLRSRLGTLVSGVRVGSVKVDRHTLDGMHGIHAFWVPDQVFCRACAEVAIVLPPEDLENQRCDRCGSTAGPVSLFTGHPFPELTIFFGLCPRCTERETGGTR